MPRTNTNTNIRDNIDNNEKDNFDSASCHASSLRDDDGNGSHGSSIVTMIPEGHLPMYLADAFGELYEEDGLIIMGKGLGCFLLLATFIRFYADTHDGYLSLLQPDEEDVEEKPAAATTRLKKPPLVLVLSLQEQERQSLLQILQCWGTPMEMMPTMITNEAGQARDRQALYARGGVFCITSRILITDLLTNVVTANDICGLLIYRAHQVTDESTEAFILRIFHAQRRPQCSGFVKAFSESADQFQSGFAKVDKVLKALRVRKLYLYPRFHDAIRQELEASSSDQQQSSSSPSAVVVTELHQPLSPLQQEIQQCFAAAVQSCIRELKQTTVGHKLEWSHADLALENCVTANFDQTISRQLEPEWHQLAASTKQLVQDLRTLRTLFQALLHYDCISFWKLLQNIRTMSASSRHASMWLLSPAADRAFRKAKERVYRIEVHQYQQKQQGKQNNNGLHVDDDDDDDKLSNTTGVVSTTNTKLVAVLEENPKWKLLRSLLEEIQTEYSQQEQEQEEWPSTVLVLVKDERTVDTLKTYLTGGKKQTLAYTWLRYLELQNDRSRAIITNSNNTTNLHHHDSATTSGAGGATSGMAALSEERRLLLEEEGRVRRILFGKHGGGGSRRGRTTTNTSKALQKQPPQKAQQRSPGGGGKPSPKRRKLNEVPAYLKKRRRVATEKGRGNVMQQSKDDLDRQAVLADAMEEVERGLGREEEGSEDDNNDDNSNDLDEEDDDSPPTTTTSKQRRCGVPAIAQRLAEAKQDDDKLTQAMFRVTNPTELRVVFKSFLTVGIESGDQDSLMLLQDLRPTHVIFYDMDVALIRSVEIYASLRRSSMVEEEEEKQQQHQQKPPPPPVKVYFLVFEQSAEEKNFKKLLEREQNAFERLIQHKMVMPPPMLHDTTQSQEMQQAVGSATSSYMDGALPLAFDSRKGQGNGGPGGGGKKAIRRDIAVDVREFRAALPSILHQGGMRLAPVTLTVGDFVLSNVHCIERKSISDLFGSFASGRLYTQAEAMCKHYKVPCLLIEFDPNKSFSLQNPNELGLDIKQDSVCTKMALLCMHFPALRLLWSKNPHETLKMFQDLKKNHEEVNVDRAIEVGRNESLEALFQGPNTRCNDDNGTNNNNNNEEEQEEDEVNETARDMLLRLPGMTVPAARRIMEQVDCLRDLADMPREKLRKIAGPVVGQKIFTFFRQDQQQQHQP